MMNSKSSINLLYTQMSNKDMGDDPIEDDPENEVSY